MSKKFILHVKQSDGTMQKYMLATTTDDVTNSDGTKTLTEILTGYSLTGHTHKYAGSSTVGGSANSAVKLETARSINGTSFNGTANITTAKWGTARNIKIGNTSKSVDGTANVTWTLDEIGAAAKSHGIHVTFSEDNPESNGTASPGVLTDVARADHIHPLQTSVTGNAGSATKLANNRNISLSGDASGSVSFNGTADANIPVTLASSGVTAGSYGPSANATPAHNATFSVPYITVDAKGRVTAASTKTITLPADNNTDTKVKNTLNNTVKAYLTGTTSATTNTGEQVFDTGVYLSTNAGELVASKFVGSLSGNATSATKATQDSVNQIIAETYIKALSVSGSTITYTKGDDSTGTITTKDTTYSTGSATVAGLTKLYTGTGTATDGTMTQAAITTALNGKANASHGTHVTWATTAPLANGTAAVGTVARVAREDHVHPLQTSVSGNAGTATKLATARTISLSGDVTGSASFDGSANISLDVIIKEKDVTKLTKSLQVTTDWMDVGIEGTDLETGSYLVQMYINDGANSKQYNEYYTGFMSWYASSTNSTLSDEILLHKAGHTPNNNHTYLRTVRQTQGILKLQIATNIAFTAEVNIEFKFKKLL